jgi:hypothetical protein
METFNNLYKLLESTPHLTSNAVNKLETPQHKKARLLHDIADLDVEGLSDNDIKAIDNMSADEKEKAMTQTTSNKSIQQVKKELENAEIESDKSISPDVTANGKYTKIIVKDVIKLHIPKSNEPKMITTYSYPNSKIKFPAGKKGEPEEVEGGTVKIRKAIVALFIPHSTNSVEYVFTQIGSIKKRKTYKKIAFFYREPYETRLNTPAGLLAVASKDKTSQNKKLKNKEKIDPHEKEKAKIDRMTNIYDELVTTKFASFAEFNADYKKLTGESFKDNF